MSIDFLDFDARERGQAPGGAIKAPDPALVARIDAALEAQRAERCRQRYDREQARNTTPPPPAPEASA